MARRSNRVTRTDVSRLGECIAERKKAWWRGQAPRVAAVTTAGISDPAVAPDSRCAVPGSLRRVRGDATAIQPAFRACRAENRRSDHVGRRYRARPDDDNWRP